jgi:hypothetical protein
MVTEDFVLGVIADANKDRQKTFAEFIAAVYQGKFIEIYLGDSYEEVSTEQISTSYPAVFCGKVVGAYRECLVLNSVYANNGTKKLEMGNLLLISERAIRGLNEIDGNGVMEDMFLRSRESLDILENFVPNQSYRKR